MRFKQYLKENAPQEFLKTRREVIDWCVCNIDNYDAADILVREDLIVHAGGTVIITGQDRYTESFINLPVQFGRCAGDFTITDRGLTTLKGCPDHVEFNFDCSTNNLTSLVGGPTNTADYNCSHNKLKNFKGCATELYGSLIADYNPITSLIGIANDVNPSHIASVTNKNRISMSWASIAMGGLGFLEMEGLLDIGVFMGNRYWTQLEQQTSDLEPFIIISRHLKGDRDIFACQQELIDAGYEAYAQL